MTSRTETFREGKSWTSRFWIDDVERGAATCRSKTDSIAEAKKMIVKLKANTNGAT